jgi:DNA helicase-2/ATP-dependent DNA helicase PcrA
VKKVNPSFLQDLNENQLKAAQKFDGPILVLAGAGSGKTKTTISRVANLIFNKIPPRELLILTFTKKAANEMKERGIKLLQKQGIEIANNNLPFFGTFHSFGYKILRFLLSKVESIDGIDKNFTIAQDAVLEKITKDLEDKYKSDMELYSLKRKDILTVIDHFQNNLIPYQESELDILAFIYIQAEMNENFNRNISLFLMDREALALVIRFYRDYKKALREINAVDFADLINLPIIILEKNPNIQNFFKKKYQYIMIDEFQDTNYTQMKLINLILNDKKNIYVVGDDAQSIYGWRGADIKYILDFQSYFPEAQVINLNINYRSAPEIVSISNKILSFSQQKHDKKEALKPFFTIDAEIKSNTYYNHYQEAEEIAKKIKEIKEKEPNSSIAVLYRVNVVGTIISKIFTENRIKYTINRGKTIIEKKSNQIMIGFFLTLTRYSNKDFFLNFLEFLTLVSNKKRYELKHILSNNVFDLSEDDFIKALEEAKIKGQKAKNILSLFSNIKKGREIIGDTEQLFKYISYFVYDLEYNKYLNLAMSATKSDTKKDMYMTTINDMETLIKMMEKYESLSEFYEDIFLTNELKDEDDKNKVKLMTIHASKGLEFDYVFIPQLAQGIFPKSKNDFHKFEEERRLCYVAFSRAKKGLYVSYSKETMILRDEAEPSVFLKELDFSLKLKKRKRR